MGRQGQVGGGENFLKIRKKEMIARYFGGGTADYFTTNKARAPFENQRELVKSQHDEAGVGG